MIDCVEIQAKFSAGYLKTETNRVLTHEDICRTAAELAYEEHMKQTSNVVKEPKDCPYYDTEKRIGEVEKENERIGLCR